MKILKRTYQLLNNKEKRAFILISILTLFPNFLEIISIGSIPIFISFIFDPNLINKYFLFLDININFNANNSQNFALYLSIVVIFIFLIKNIFIGYLYYLNSKFVQNINIRIGNQIYSNNIFSSYLKYIEKSPAELIRNHTAIRGFANILAIIKDCFLRLHY